MRHLLALLILLTAQALFAGGAKAQAQSRPCPSVTVHDDAGFAVEGQVCPGSITFTAEVGALNPAERPTFQWKVSGGNILEGQGTPTVKVSAFEIGDLVTATVDVVGLSSTGAECSRRATAKVRVTECLCPKIIISCPTDLLTSGKPATVSVRLTGGSPRLTPTYAWKVSPGNIISGQGTPQVEVPWGGGQSVTVTIEVGGLQPECERVRSCTFTVSKPFPKPQPSKFDEYGRVSLRDEEARLNNLGIRLMQESRSQAYVIVYGPRGVNQRLARVRNFLVEKHQIEPGRITLMNGGYNRKTKVELWIAPTGAAAPKPDPDF